MTKAIPGLTAAFVTVSLAIIAWLLIRGCL